MSQDEQDVSSAKEEAIFFEKNLRPSVPEVIPIGTMSLEILARKNVRGLSNHLTSDNKGYAMMVKMGFIEGRGLGSRGQGRTEPVEMEWRIGKQGFGIKTEIVGRKVARKDRKAARKLQIQHKKKIIRSVRRAKLIADIAEFDKSVVQDTGKSDLDEMCDTNLQEQREESDAAKAVRLAEEMESSGRNKLLRILQREEQIFYKQFKRGTVDLEGIFTEEIKGPSTCEYNPLAEKQVTCRYDGRDEAVSNKHILYIQYTLNGFLLKEYNETINYKSFEKNDKGHCLITCGNSETLEWTLTLNIPDLDERSFILKPTLRMVHLYLPISSEFGDITPGYVLEMLQWQNGDINGIKYWKLIESKGQIMETKGVQKYESDKKYSLYVITSPETSLPDLRKKYWFLHFQLSCIRIFPVNKWSTSPTPESAKGV